MSAEAAMPPVTGRAPLPTADDFTSLSRHLKRLCGINLPLNEKNLALMSSRLQKLRSRGVASYAALIAALDRGDARAADLFVSAMTTNTTHFFRESQHFDILTKIVLEELAPAGSGRPELKVWCAASSTGEEPYGLAMCLDDLTLKRPFTFKLLATDIDSRVLDTARLGRYSEKQLESVPQPFLGRYFDRLADEDGGAYAVKASLRAHVHFGRLNLLFDYPFTGKFHAIFCRNVLIYFDRETVAAVIGRMTQALVPGGHLFLGHSEAIAGMVPGLKRAGPAVYRRA
jgi:chemotaxis protein methyltransferase CheR